MEKDLEAQVVAGQEALGRLLRQFFAVNDFKHIQFMTMAHAATGTRWLHSSQISTLKQGGTRHLTGFPLFSVAAVNRYIFNVNAGLASPPTGTRKADWEGKHPMLKPDGQPLDVGDLWRIYFGEMEPPLFTLDGIEEIDEPMAQKLSVKLHDYYLDHCREQGVEPMAFMATALKGFKADPAMAKLLRGVLLGVLELDAATATDLLPALADWMGQLQGKEVNERQVLALLAAM